MSRPGEVLKQASSSATILGTPQPVCSGLQGLGLPNKGKMDDVRLAQFVAAVEQLEGQATADPADIDALEAQILATVWRTTEERAEAHELLIRLVSHC